MSSEQKTASSHAKKGTPSEQLRVRHGRLEDRSVSELLFFAFITGMDGTLTCSRDGIIKTLRFKSGKLLEARSNDPHDSSQWILHEMGKLSESLSSSGKDTSKSGLSASDTMKLLSAQIKDGVMQPVEIQEFLHRRVRRILHDLMSWRKGDYVLELSRVPRSEPALKVTRAIPEMIMREMKTAPDPVGLRELMEDPSIIAEPITKSTEFSREIRLTAVERRILNAVRKPISVRKITMSEGMGLESTSRILLGLAAVDLIRIDYRKKRKRQADTSGAHKQEDQHISRPASATAEASTAMKKQQRIPYKFDEIDALLLSPEDDEILDTSKINTDTQALSYLIDRIQDSFSWNPYEVLHIDRHDNRDTIEAAYTRHLDAVLSFRKFCSSATKEYLTSYLAILEEARAILTSNTLRKRFNQLQAIVDPQKKLSTAVMEHKRSLQAFKIKRLVLSLIHLKFAIFLDPNNAEYQYKLIYLATQNRRLWALGKLLQEYCLERFGTNPTIIALAGLLHHQIGNKIKARSFYERALKMDPEHELARQGLNILNRPTRR